MQDFSAFYSKFDFLRSKSSFSRQLMVVCFRIFTNVHIQWKLVKICFAPLRGIEPRPRRWKRRILATRPQGMMYDWKIKTVLSFYVYVFVNIKYFNAPYARKSIRFHLAFLSDLKHGFSGMTNSAKMTVSPLRGIEPRPRRWKRRILATRPQGRMLKRRNKSVLRVVQMTPDQARDRNISCKFWYSGNTFICRPKKR